MDMDWRMLEFIELIRQATGQSSNTQVIGSLFTFFSDDHLTLAGTITGIAIINGTLELYTSPCGAERTILQYFPGNKDPWCLIQKNDVLERRRPGKLMVHGFFGYGPKQC